MAAWTAAFGAEVRALLRAREVVVAVELAEDRLTAVELHALDRLPSLPDSLRSGTFTPPFQDYRWEADVHSVSGMALVEVTMVVAGPAAEHRVTTVLPLRSLRTDGR